MLNPLIVKFLDLALELFTAVVFFNSLSPELQMTLGVCGFCLEIVEAVLSCWRGWYDGR